MQVITTCMQHLHKTVLFASSRMLRSRVFCLHSHDGLSTSEAGLFSVFTKDLANISVFTKCKL